MSVTGSRGTRTGDEVRDSTPTTTASFVTNPRIRRPKVAIPRRSASPISWRGDLMLAAVLPGQLFELLLEL